MSKETSIRLCISVPGSLAARINPVGRQSMSSRAVELIEIGLQGREKVVIKQNVVIRPGTLQYTPLAPETEEPLRETTVWDLIQ